MIQLSATEIPEKSRKPHLDAFRRRLHLELRDPTLTAYRRKEIQLWLASPNGERPYAALAALQQESR